MIPSRTLPELATAPRTADTPPVHAPLSADDTAARRRSAAAVALSVLVNVLLVLAILITLPPPPILVSKPIPVQIVPVSAIPKPAPKPPIRPRAREAARPTPPKPPERGATSPQRLASQEMGDPKAPVSAKIGNAARLPGAAMPEEGSTQPDDKGDATHAAAAQPRQTAALGTARPNPEKLPKPAHHHGGAKVSAILAPPQPTRHHAPYPGPDATEDAYLKYLKELVMDATTEKMVGERLTVAHDPNIEIAVRGNGVILWSQITRSSGSAALDRDFIDLFDRIGRFPPLPRYIQLNTGGWTSFTYGDDDSQ